MPNLWPELHCICDEFENCSKWSAFDRSKDRFRLLILDFGSCNCSCCCCCCCCCSRCCSCWAFIPPTKPQSLLRLILYRSGPLGNVSRNWPPVRLWSTEKKKHKKVIYVHCIVTRFSWWHEKLPRWNQRLSQIFSYKNSLTKKSDLTWFFYTAKSNQVFHLSKIIHTRFDMILLYFICIVFLSILLEYYNFHRIYFRFLEGVQSPFLGITLI